MKKFIIIFTLLQYLAILSFSLASESISKCKTCYISKSHNEILHIRRAQSLLFTHPHEAFIEADYTLRRIIKTDNKELIECAKFLRKKAIDSINQVQNINEKNTILQQYETLTMDFDIFSPFEKLGLEKIKLLNELKKTIICLAITNDPYAIEFLARHLEIKISSKYLRQISNNQEGIL